MTNPEIARAYRELFKSPLGQDIMERIERIYSSQLDSATKSGKETAWGLLSRAAGIQLIKSEFIRVQSIDKKGGGR